MSNSLPVTLLAPIPGRDMRSAISIHTRPLWNPYVAGVAMGIALLLAFVATGHGLGVTGATTSLTAVIAGRIAPTAIEHNRYLGSYFLNGLNSWIVWEVLGIAAGALVASLVGKRFRLEFDGPTGAKRGLRVSLALAGGLASGFGARMAMGCTSGMGLSGSSTLAAAGFLFLIGFFVAGIAFGKITKGLWA